MAHYEIEIKSLLGEREVAEALITTMCRLDPTAACVARNTQLNHYFEGGDLAKLSRAIAPHLTRDAIQKLDRILSVGADFSVRTRQKDDTVLLVVKAAVDGGTSANAVSRLEFEEPVAMSLADLDTMLLEVGFVYQAKWSREREEYTYKGAAVCIDKNAGYGYLAEFEKVVPEGEPIDAVRRDLESLMAELGVRELPQDRLARMFAHYNSNWAEYYGTDKTFVID